ncbi:hypothetical protein L7F22_062025 [Adiantum nelumboides]|nr:hypothetical protein [Adiantum nelumboides]
MSPSVRLIRACLLALINLFFFLRKERRFSFSFFFPGVGEAAFRLRETPEALSRATGEQGGKAERGQVIFKGAAIFVFQQFAGFNAIVYFSSTIFRNAGVASSLAASVSVGFVNLFASCITTYLIDRLGRKTLLIWSFSGMSLGMAIQSCAVVLPMVNNTKSYVLLFGTLFYILMFAMGVGPVPMALLPEMFPNFIRAKAMAICLSVLWITCGLIGMLYLPILNKYGDFSLFTAFAVVSLCGMIFVKLCIDETKGKSLEKIEASLYRDDPKQLLPNERVC